jgi:hypothetical protein
MSNKKHNIESVFLTTLKSGQSFYTSLPDKDITAAGCYYGVKVKTERLIVINHITLIADRITKVTIL